MTGEVTGSTAMALKEGLRGLMTSATPVIVPPVPTPATRMSTLPVGVLPDLLGRSFYAMDLRIRRVLKLLAAWKLLGVLLRQNLLRHLLIGRVAHPLGGGCQHDLARWPSAP